MTVSELTGTGGFEAAVHGESDKEITTCYIGDLLSWVMGRAPAGSAWITIMTNVNVAAVALLADTACVICAEGTEPDAALIEKAAQNGVAVLKTKLDAYGAACRIYRLLGGE